ncbi:MAG: DUF1540 domain-containing protein [Cellulosilyticaceae bacterium]
MPILNCSIHNCSYNRDNNCCIEAINVGQSGSTNAGHTCCNNFVSTEYTNSNEVHHPSITVSIECEAAGCIHNNTGTCLASKVAIGGDATACCIEDTDCRTFVCK